MNSVLLETDATFDAACGLVCRPAVTPGYHTRIVPGTMVHSTRESMGYALALFESGEVWRQERACLILEKILTLQVTDPTSAWFGLWGWFYEEPPDQMAPADWNWADFIGAYLAEIVARFSGSLSPELLAETRAALDRAAWAIFRRNVRTDYTNICAMGAAVTLAAGDLLTEPRLLAYGLRRLRNLRELVEKDGGFTEYNSSTYTLVALIEFERILGLVRNSEARAEAEKLYHHTWRLIGEQFHPGTGQWAGPACRSYNDWLDEPKQQFLEERLGFRLVHRSGPKIGFFGDAFFSSHPRPCPDDLKERFRALPTDPHVFTNCWVRDQEGNPAQISTTWFSGDATLGSMNRESTWVQRRVVLGYWRTPQDEAVRLRLRMLHDGKDFSSGFVWNDQQGRRLLTGAHFVTGQGDFHPTLDLPADGIFPATDLRLRLEVEGRGLKLQQVDDHLYFFTAGHRRLALHPGPAWFDGRPVADWQSGGEGDCRWVDLIFHSGTPIAFNPATVGETMAALALELLPAAEEASPHAITSTVGAARRVFMWQTDRTYAVSVPLRGEKRPWP